MYLDTDMPYCNCCTNQMPNEKEFHSCLTIQLFLNISCVDDGRYTICKQYKP